MNNLATLQSMRKNLPDEGQTRTRSPERVAGSAHTETDDPPKHGLIAPATNPRRKRETLAKRRIKTQVHGHALHA
ncbi:hypothetical protein [Acidihalobacter ferrooxydans]|uniref:hypothetical protein n=1 Tax=Acidihalobacter ferrooxydans TaxID=1765967 RepID=UPI0012EB64A8|nr:hypothetical protein [Acidihalobacter ferrooxydans]